VVTLVSSAPNGPFSSGQLITVDVGPNGILPAGSQLYIRECAAPGGVLPTSFSQCDRKTIAPVTVGPDGTISYSDYTVYALPDAAVLGEHPGHTPVCNLTHACVLYIGQYDFNNCHVFSSVFFVHPTPGDTGADPGNGLPEAPYVLALPLVAAAILGGVVLTRRRRARASGPV
jgi:hypothetical protein